MPKRSSIVSAASGIRRKQCGTTSRRAWARTSRRTMTSCRCAHSGPNGTGRCSRRLSPASRTLQPEEADMHSVSRSDVEDFLFAEADLLDQWRLPEWLTLFTDDAKYEGPCTDLPPDASPDTNLFYIADDPARLGERGKRLMKRPPPAAFPHSKTRRNAANRRMPRRR